MKEIINGIRHIIHAAPPLHTGKSQPTVGSFNALAWRLSSPVYIDLPYKGSNGTGSIGSPFVRRQANAKRITPNLAQNIVIK